MTDDLTYCGAEFGEVRAGECECPRCVTAQPDTTELRAVAERLHQEHVREFPWMAGDRLTDPVLASQCGNCQRWAQYAHAALLDENTTLRHQIAAVRALADEWEEFWENPPRKWAYFLSKTVPTISAKRASAQLHAALDQPTTPGGTP